MYAHSAEVEDYDVLWGKQVAAAAPHLSPPGMECPLRTLVLFERGPNWDKAAKMAPEHFAYILQQMKSGKVLSGGPLEGAPPRAAMLFAAGDWGQVEALLKLEPFTREGVLKVASHEVWNACEAAK
jgi:hypothetical protein